MATYKVTINEKTKEGRELLKMLLNSKAVKIHKFNKLLADAIDGVEKGKIVDYEDFHKMVDSLLEDETEDIDIEEVKRLKSLRKELIDTIKKRTNTSSKDVYNAIVKTWVEDFHEMLTEEEIEKNMPDEVAFEIILKRLKKPKKMIKELAENSWIISNSKCLSLGDFQKFRDVINW